jgi:hypothetical protein
VRLFCTAHLVLNALVDDLGALFERHALSSMLGFHPALLSSFRLGERLGCRFHRWRVSALSSATAKDRCCDQQEAERGNIGAGESRVVHRENRPEVLAAETLAILGTIRKVARVASRRLFKEEEMKAFLIVFWIHQVIFGLSSLGAVLNLLLEGDDRPIEFGSAITGLDRRVSNLGVRFCHGRTAAVFC